MPDLETAATGRDQSDRIIVPLPSLGADMDVGTVIEWCVGVGDRVERGDVVAIVSTEKSDIDVESWDSGIVTELIAPIDVEIEVGQPLLALGTEQPAETEVPSMDESPIEPAPPEPAAAEPADGGPTEEPRERPTRVRASPLARRLAAEQGVPLSSIVGTGPAGAIVATDVSAVPAPAPPTPPAPAPPTPPASAPPTPPASIQTESVTSPPPLSGMRKAIAERMARSHRDIPHYHLDREVDMTACLDWLADHNADLPIASRVVPAALLACAVARAAHEVPSLNGTWPEDRFLPAPSVDLGIVVSLRTGGLVTPTVVEADGFDPDQMMATMREMVTAARKGQLRSRWMAPASITVTNLGDNGADRVAGIIFPPQVALVGFGRIMERPSVVEGAVVPRKVVTATLAGDHRATDGAEGSRFLASVARLLDDPELLLS